MLDQLAYTRDAQTGRASSWDKTGRNRDAWWIEPGQSADLADLIRAAGSTIPTARSPIGKSPRMRR